MADRSFLSRKSAPKASSAARAFAAQHFDLVHAAVEHGDAVEKKPVALFLVVDPGIEVGTRQGDERRRAGEDETQLGEEDAASPFSSPLPPGQQV